MYADKVTDSMRLAMDETSRRRTIQQKYNEEHGIVPKRSLKKSEIWFLLRKNRKMIQKKRYKSRMKKWRKKKRYVIDEIRKEMKNAAKALDFETAANVRDMILELKASK